MRHQATAKKPSPAHVDGALQYIGNAPARLVTPAAYWAGALGPIHEMLDDPEAEFEQAAKELQKVCIANSIGYRPASPDGPAAFPVWLLREIYSRNP